ncbi:MauE/DoxX family redox-associated membrane protein [Pseudooceanicola sp. LIPI14-2-Ac024]|uniref:MauE/DoxX family redox-associated membrane protein n=1 Tax=Pseudooceanicola sp. LIPI14-2-Ac024 TaxID=3344875 RepID=UPI0035D0411E
MPDHLCPFGLKSKWLLEREGYAVEDHHLTTRAETDAFMQKHGVKTTPQTFIGDERIGGYDDLRAFFGDRLKEADETSYRPVVAIFGTGFLMALAVMWMAGAALVSLATLTTFIAISMVLLGIQKLQDVESFSTMFLNYDLLARQWVPYGYIYPYAETLAGLLMLAGVLPWVSGPLAFFIGAIGAASVIKAVYVDRRELKCACVGGGSNVPLGFVSLTENIMMLLMGLWTISRLM